jgi:hypothetical protein
VAVLVNHSIHHCNKQQHSRRHTQSSGQSPIPMHKKTLCASMMLIYVHDCRQEHTIKQPGGATIYSHHHHHHHTTRHTNTTSPMQVSDAAQHLWLRGGGALMHADRSDPWQPSLVSPAGRHSLSCPLGEHMPPAQQEREGRQGDAAEPHGLLAVQCVLTRRVCRAHHHCCSASNLTVSRPPASRRWQCTHRRWQCTQHQRSEGSTKGPWGLPITPAHPQNTHPHPHKHTYTHTQPHTNADTTTQTDCTRRSAS